MNPARSAAAIPVVVALVGATLLPADTSNIDEIVYEGIPVNEFPDFPITVLDKEFYVIGYSEDFLNPAWVFYRIGPATDLDTRRVGGRFRIDRDTRSRVRHDDYTHSGFSRGHMAPSFALTSRFRAAGGRSTFVMSNVCPQFQSLNDGQWGDLEEWIAGRKRSADHFIRGWADVLDEVWVVVGPLFDEDGEELDSGVPVPNAFFCIVVDEQNNAPRALAFIMDHEDTRRDDLTPFLTTVDEVEARAGFDFFPDLADDIENALEAASPQRLWTLPEAPN